MQHKIYFLQQIAVISVETTKLIRNFFQTATGMSFVACTLSSIFT